MCGREYGIAHDCSGPNQGQAALVAEWAAPPGFATLHYLRKAFAIARLNEGAVQAASLEAPAAFYGIFILLVGQVAVFKDFFWSETSGSVLLTYASFLFFLVLQTLFTFAQLAAVHFCAKRFFGGRGTFIGVIRPYLLGSIVSWTAFVPYVGLFVAAIWHLAMMMIVFEEVDHIRRIQAFGLAFGLGNLFRVILAGLGLSG